MPLSKPEDLDDDAPEPPEPSDPVTDEPMVEVEWLDEPLPVSDAVESHDEMLMSDDDSGVASNRHVRELQKEVEQLRDIVEAQSDLMEQLVLNLWMVSMTDSIDPDIVWDNMSGQFEGVDMDVERIEQTKQRWESEVA